MIGSPKAKSAQPNTASTGTAFTHAQTPNKAATLLLNSLMPLKSSNLPTPMSHGLSSTVVILPAARALSNRTWSSMSARSTKDLSRFPPVVDSRYQNKFDNSLSSIIAIVDVVDELVHVEFTDCPYFFLAFYVLLEPI